VDEWKLYLQKVKEQATTQAVTWEKPPSDWVKINIDAVYSDATRSGWWGAICRDMVSNIQFAAAGNLKMISDSMHAETMALSHAVQIAEQLGVGRVIFETDCANLQRAINSSDYDFAPLGVLFSDLKFRLRMSFIEAKVVYASQICNKPAHELAAMGTRVDHEEHCLWVMNYPESVTRLVTGDFAVS
jgi:ribonuclease HI